MTKDTFHTGLASQRRFDSVQLAVSAIKAPDRTGGRHLGNVNERKQQRPWRRVGWIEIDSWQRGYFSALINAADACGSKWEIGISDSWLSCLLLIVLRRLINSIEKVHRLLPSGTSSRAQDSIWNVIAVHTMLEELLDISLSKSKDTSGRDRSNS